MLEIKNYKKAIPASEHIIVRRHDSETVTEGGIVIPDAAQEKPETGTVIGVPEGSMFQEADVVMFSKFVGTEFAIDNQKCIIMREDDVLCRLE